MAKSSDKRRSEAVSGGAAAAVRTPIPRRTWFLIVMLAFVGQVAWAIENNFFNLFIQDVFGASLADVALMVSASAITATATTLLVGAWSDRLGRRKAFIVVGTILWGISIALFAVLQNISAALAKDAAAAAGLGITLTIVFDCIMTFFGSTANDSTFNAWLTDITDDTNRGRVEGVNSSMPLLSMLLYTMIPSFIIGFFQSVALWVMQTYILDVEPLHPLSLFGVLVLVCGVVTAVLMKDSAPEPQRDRSYLADIAFGFKPSSMREHRMLYLVLLAYCVFAIAMQVIMPYYVLYLRLPYILGESYVFVMAPCIIIAAVFTIFYGRRVDKVGFVRAIIVPLVLFLAGCAVLTFLTAGAGVFVGSMLMLSGYLGAVACLGAEIRNNTPLDRVGLFQGIRIFMIVLVPMLIGPWIGSAISAGSASMVGFGVVGDGFTPSSLIFLGGALVSLLTFVVLFFISKAKGKAQAE